MKNIIILLLLIIINNSVFAKKSIINIYIWGGEIPESIIQKFEKETGIQVNFSTYDNNETMYTKLKTSKTNIYDIILPSSYFVERMKVQGMLQHINHQQLPNLKNLDYHFLHHYYDFNNQYSVPITWGVTGIFYNNTKINSPPNSWKNFWNKIWKNQLMLLDDSREIFSISLISLGYNPNDKNPNHIKQAFKHLLKLIPNIKLFASDNVQSIIVDEDAIIGAVWNSDILKSEKENKHIKFYYPKEGFIVWIDCLAIPKNPPHIKEAYKFINFILQPNISKQITLNEGLAITNYKGFMSLPKSIKINPIIYPSGNILNRAYFQRDLGEKILKLYNEYWQELKMSF
ncbi:spermidine/putrescine ABC transporter substrate-binding protein [Candidatus Legionella polyplacis]|uniref:Putrescine-binding periplasmic protein n=1 Tax=Candidatus Legionella polyplacis TaxID=2005262 RepID=A0ABZ2GY33_9GAMM